MSLFTTQRFLNLVHAAQMMDVALSVTPHNETLVILQDWQSKAQADNCRMEFFVCTDTGDQIHLRPIDVDSLGIKFEIQPSEEFPEMFGRTLKVMWNNSVKWYEMLPVDMDKRMKGCGLCMGSANGAFDLMAEELVDTMITGFRK